MPSIGHVAVGLAAGRAAKPDGRYSLRWLLWFVAISCAADLDFVFVALGAPYNSLWGHRGVSHSLGVAVLAGLLTAWVARRWGLSAGWGGLAGFLAYGSHVVLDSLNVGSVGVPWFWPLTPRYYTLPWHPIPSVETARDFLTPAGIPVLAAETLLFAPFWLYALLARRLNAVRGRSSPGGAPVLPRGPRVEGAVD